MKRIAIFYGSKGGNTEAVARKIHQAFGEEHADLYAIPDVEPDILKNYDYIIFGVSTVGADSWDQHHPHNSWDPFLAALKNIDLSGKKAAVFGLGDQILYPEHFCDDMKLVWDRLKEQGAEMTGEWYDEDYEFSDSKAFVNDHFVGLAVDEDQQFDLTDDRVKKWIESLKKEFGLNV